MLQVALGWLDEQFANLLCFPDMNRSVYWMKLDFNAENSGDFCFGSGLNNGRVVINDPDIISP